MKTIKSYKYKLIPYSPFPFDGFVSTQLQINQKELNLEFTWPKEWDLSEFLPQGPQQRAHELWKSSCFEAFIKKNSSFEYDEINLSPSGQWNVYHFTNYRIPSPPQEADGWLLSSLMWEPGKFSSTLTHPYKNIQNLAVNLTCILRIRQISHYWALKHNFQKPDFHWPDGFLKLED